MNGEALGSLVGVLPLGMDALVQRALPPHPLHSLPTLAIPRPGLLTSEMTQEHRALLVVRAYLGALKAGKVKTSQWATYRVGVPALPDITAAKAYPVLCELADLLLEHRLPPAAWAAWRLETLQHNKTEAFKVPTLPALMSKAWLTQPQRRGWFRSTFDTYKPRLIETPATTILRERWDTMLAAVHVAAPSDAATVRAIFELHFTGDSLAVLTRRAAEQIESMRKHYDRQLEEGAWLW